MANKKALLIVNIGTPEKPKKKEVYHYLMTFLNDKRVIDLPWFFRKILVNLIIVPFRLSYSTKLYKKLWTQEGSPLFVYLLSLSNKLQQKLKGQYKVYKAMCYGKPNIYTVLNQIKKDNIEELILLPLFPQYASSTTGSIFEKVFKEIKKWEVIPSMRIIGQFYNHSAFINTFANQIMQYDLKSYDHIIFSYHGLPLKQINKIHPNKNFKNCECEKEINIHGTKCYKATCYETTRLLARKINVSKNNFSIAFQSRFSKKWLAPFTDKLIVDLAQNDIKKILIVAPSFVADCLETIIEIGDHYETLFKKHGGEKLTLVKSLNDSDEWVNAIIKMI